MSRSWLPGLGVLLLFVASACGQPAGTTVASPASAPVRAVLPIEFSSCAEVDGAGSPKGLRCWLRESRELILWTASAETLSCTTEGGAAIPVAMETVAGGARYRLEVPAGTREVVAQTRDGLEALRLPVLDHEHVPELQEAKELRSRGELAAARTVFERYVATHADASSSRHVAAARAALASMVIDEGDYERAVSELRSALAHDVQLRRVSSAALGVAGLTSVLSSTLERHAEARHAIEDVRELVEPDPTSRAVLTYSAGLIAFASGDFRSALRQLRGASLQFERLGLLEYRLAAREQESYVLAALGRDEEAVSVQLDVAQQSTNEEPCAVADRFEGVAWLALSMEAARDSYYWHLAREHSRRAESALAQCTNPQRHRNHLIDAGLLALQSGELGAVQRALQSLSRQKAGDSPVEAVWEWELRGRYELARERWRDARRAFERARDVASEAGLWQSEYLAWLGIARSQRRHPSALASYQKAEELQREVLAWVPVSEGQAGFHRAYEAGTRELIELLLELGQPEAALTALRSARSGVVAAAARASRVQLLGTEARSRWEAAVAAYQRERSAYEALLAEAWRKPVDQQPSLRARLQEAAERAHGQLDATQAALGEVAELEASATGPRGQAPLGDGEALVAYFSGSRALYALVQSRSGTHALPLPGIAPSSPATALSEAWLSPLLAEVGSARRLRLLLPPELEPIDFHALPLDGAPLLQRFEVVYALDVSNGVALDKASARDLIVANPQHNLPNSELEGTRVLHWLRDTATVWSGKAAARARVLAALPGLRRFHYAGHARYAGLEGIDSALVLADGELAVGEIMTLRGAPELVVLSACEAAKEGGEGIASGLGLAQAFVTAGARFVVAAHRPAEDEASRVFFEHYYAALHGLTSPDAPVTAWRQAALQLYADGSRHWAQFRVITP